VFIKKNVKLAKYNTFHTGGPAEFFVEVKSIDDLKKAVEFAKKNKLKISILGSGSNILIADRRLKGLVIKINIRGIAITGNTILAGAGESWDKVVAKAVSKDLWGIENLSLIPGTVGGAVYQNIGAYGAQIKDVLNFVDVFDTKIQKLTRLSSKDCRLDYRTSAFQDKKGAHLIIIGASLMLNKNKNPNLKYPDLVEHFKNKEPTLNEIRKAVIKIRKKKLVYPTAGIGTAGSFFKNPIITVADYQKLLSDYPDIKGREIGDGLVKLSAGQLIQMTGWKGKKLGKTGVSEKHALVLVSYKGAQTKDILKLAQLVQRSVKNRFNVLLESEVKIVA